MRAAAALAFLLALTAGYFWKLTLSRDYTWLENPDQALQVRPWLDYEARELHAGRLPLWDPYQWGGQSLIGQVQPGLANPLNWILFAMPLSGGRRHRIEFRYRPGSVIWGAALTACGVLLTGLFCALDRRRPGMQLHSPDDSSLAAM